MIIFQRIKSIFSARILKLLLLTKWSLLKRVCREVVTSLTTRIITMGFWQHQADTDLGGQKITAQCKLQKISKYRFSIMLACLMMLILRMHAHQNHWRTNPVCKTIPQHQYTIKTNLHNRHRGGILICEEALCAMKISWNKSNAIWWPRS